MARPSSSIASPGRPCNEDNQAELVPRVTMAGLHRDDLSKQRFRFRQPARDAVAEGELEGGFDGHDKSFKCSVLSFKWSFLHRPRVASGVLKLKT